MVAISHGSKLRFVRAMKGEIELELGFPLVVLEASLHMFTVLIRIRYMLHIWRLPSVITVREGPYLQVKEKLDSWPDKTAYKSQPV